MLCYVPIRFGWYGLCRLRGLGLFLPSVPSASALGYVVLGGLQVQPAPRFRPGRAGTRLSAERSRQSSPLTPLAKVLEYKYMKTQLKESRVAVKLGVSRQVVIPKRIHEQLGLMPGDYLEVKLEGDHLILTPQALIDKRLAAGIEDIRKGHVHGPFRSAAALVRSLHKGKKTKTA